jgi:dihydroorotate dehydrogenase electron transfer subunit
VETNIELCREHFRLRLRVAGRFPPTRPGQFIQLGCRPPAGADDDDALGGEAFDWRPGERIAPTQPELVGPVAFLRRPFSISGRGDDERGTWLEVIGREVGVGTRWLAQLDAGDAIDLIGPLGNAFEPAASKSLGLMVGGGVGLPPMFYLAEALAAAGWRAVGFVGAQSADLLAVTIAAKHQPDRDGVAGRCVEQFGRFGFDAVVTTDDGTAGMRGLITDGFARHLGALGDDEKAQAVVFTCGPEPMMHAVADLAQAHGIDCQVCLEQAMACGMGTCQSCVVRIEDHANPHGRSESDRPWRYKLACTDGPVFGAAAVVW